MWSDEASQDVGTLVTSSKVIGYTEISNVLIFFITCSTVHWCLFLLRFFSSFCPWKTSAILPAYIEATCNELLCISNTYISPLIIFSIYNILYISNYIYIKLLWHHLQIRYVHIGLYCCRWPNVTLFYLPIVYNKKENNGEHATRRPQAKPFITSMVFLVACYHYKSPLRNNPNETVVSGKTMARSHRKSTNREYWVNESER